LALSENVVKLIGRTTTATFEVEKGAIARFAEAVGDPNPLYWNPDVAAKSAFGCIIAPPGFFGWPERDAAELPNDLIALADLLAEAGYSRILDGGIEMEFFKPVKAGDRLTVKTNIRNIMERSGKTGKAVFLFRDIAYSNQKGELVATVRSTTIHPADTATS
jgi:acyl dehydratase